MKYQTKKFCRRKWSNEITIQNKTLLIFVLAFLNKIILCSLASNGILFTAATICGCL